MTKKTSRTPPPAFFYASAALAGAAIMAVEILGAKLLAPYVGTSHFVWLAQITVTLAALAAGYFFGGRLADRAPRPRPLFYCMGGAALYLAASLPAVETVAFACLRCALPLGSLLAAAFLYFVPLCLLAATSPFYVRLVTRDVADVGKKSGALSAAATLGSVAGTAFVGYVVIPQLPNSITLLGVAGALMLWCVYYFVRYERGGKARTAAALLLFLCLSAAGVREALACRYALFTRLYRAQTPFGELQVLDEPDGHARILLDNLLYQNVYDPVRRQSLADFTYMLEFLGTAYTEKIDRALCIGMGMGVLPSELAKAGARVDVVEINAGMVYPAETFFDCDTARFCLRLGDARTFLNDAQSGVYDAVFLDAFSGDAPPAHLFSKEAFAAVKRVLKPTGVLVVNTFGDADGDGAFALGSLVRTLREGAGFGTVRIHADNADGNLYVLAGNAPLRLRRFPDFGRVHPAVRDTVARAFNRTIPAPNAGMVLTDDFNPLEFYDAKTRERTRRDFALAARDY